MPTTSNTKLLTEDITRILKDDILPAWNNQINVEPSPFLEKISKKPLKAKTIRAAAKIGLNGGYGAGTEGTETPSAAPQLYEEFKVSPVAMFAEIKISDMSFKLANGGEQSIIDAVRAETEGAYEASKFHLSRMLFMDGTGKLATVTAGTGTVVTVSSTLYLREGLSVDFYATAAAVGSAPAVANKRIIAIDHVNKKITLDSTATVPAGFMTVQNSYGREMTGLGAIFDTSRSELYGVNRAANMFINPSSKSAEKDISDVLINEQIRNADRYHSAKTDMVLMGDEAFNAYQLYMKANNTVIVNNLQFKGGAAGYEIIFGNRKAAVVNEGFVPATEVWGVDTTAFSFYKTDFDFAQEGGSSAFQLMEKYSWYRALLSAYGNLICNNPGGSWKLTDAGV